ncbi:Hypothetical protein CAP_6253 [Chondromyces apiculatus DSM 436]|uniref:Uncharacterized protein n=1 Tax=Chondromyces apiculatus DSM 436 TaxID=1192034 RepID=A0A017T371_9BACT|nr:Hypothetical protein CAP_6253 [Chondromyces apiculatus DSM 436]
MCRRRGLHRERAAPGHPRPVLRRGGGARCPRSRTGAVHRSGVYVPVTARRAGGVCLDCPASLLLVQRSCSRSRREPSPLTFRGAPTSERMHEGEEQQYGSR